MLTKEAANKLKDSERMTGYSEVMCLVNPKSGSAECVLIADNSPLIRRMLRSHAVGLFRLFGRRDLNLNGLNVVGLCGVHGDYSKTAVRAAGLNGSRGLRSGRAWAHRVRS